jgi:hypothetical protein
MRAVFSVLGLLIVVAVIGVLAKKQLASVAGPTVVPAVAATPDTAGAPPATPQQTVKQFQQAVESQMQQPRAMPDDPK